MDMRRGKELEVFALEVKDEQGLQEKELQEKDRQEKEVQT